MLPQVCLPVRKAAAATIPVARLMGDNSLANASEAELQQLHALERSFLAQIPQRVSLEDGLDDFCREQAEIFRSVSDISILGAGRKTLSPRLKGIAAEIAKPRCTVCKGRIEAKQQPCTGDQKDDVNVAGGAACLREVFDALGFVKGLVESHLSDVFADGGPRRLAIRLHTTFSAGEEDVSGACTHDQAQLGDVVSIGLPQYGFTFSALTRTPYTLAHEVLCHAGQSIEGDGGRETRGEYCPWTEGWMDCLAAEILTDALLAKDRAIQARGLSIPKWMRDEAPAIVQATDTAHNGRLSTDLPRLEYRFRQRMSAHHAWRKFPIAAVKAGMREDEAIDLRRSVCLAYNAMTRPALERENVGIRLTNYFLFAQGDIPAVEAFQRFRNSGSVNNFCKEISMLSYGIGLPPFVA